MIQIGLKMYEVVQQLFLTFLKMLNFFKKSEKWTNFINLRNPRHFLDSVATTAKQFEQIKAQNHAVQIFWFHVASAGELEQVVPLADVLHEKMNAYFFVTYYSASAIPFLKNVPWCLGSSGLPIDTLKTYQTAHQVLKFQKLFFVRYDLWPALIFFAVQKNIKLNLLCATKTKTSKGFFALLSKKWNLFLYKKFQNIFVSFQDDLQFFRLYLPHQTIVFTGDTKWHRSWQRAQTFQTVLNMNRHESTKFVDFFLSLQNHIKMHDLKCLVFGSPHSEEHDIALKYLSYLKDKLFMVYVPHKISKESCATVYQQIKESGGSACFYSDFVDGFSFAQYSVVIIDSMGHLAEIYALAHIGVIGGGFDGQIHNVLEPTAHGIPILIGENFLRAPEAKILVDSKVAFAFADPNLLFQFLVQWGTLKMHMKELQNASDKAFELFRSMPDTNKIILDTLLQETQYDNKTIDH